MRGVVMLGDRRVAVRDFPDPVPGPRQVVVRMRVAAVCGSDLHGYRAPAEARKGRENRIPGHEPSGDVVALGDEVRNVKIGDRVAIYHYLGCGRCKHCLSGYLLRCPEHRGYGGPIDGSDADLLLTDEINCLPLPAELSYVDGAFIACQASTAYAALEKLRPTGEDTLLVVGLGPVGLCTVVFAKAFGTRVIGVDVTEERRELGRKLGADEVVCAGADGLGKLKSLTDGEGPNLAVEASGSADGQRALVEALSIGGRAVLVGLGSGEMHGSINQIIDKELTLMGSHVAPIQMFWDLASFMVRHRISLEPIVSHRFGIEEAPEAFRVADTARAGKVIFEWGA